MAFTRSTWHSGLTYRQTCRQCKAVLKYTDKALDFRPWFADGFIYCPKCKTPLRHNERYAINSPAQPTINIDAPKQDSSVADTEHKAKFCTSCGKKYGQTDVFCSHCGHKR